MFKGTVAWDSLPAVYLLQQIQDCDLSLLMRYYHQCILVTQLGSIFVIVDLDMSFLVSTSNNFVLCHLKNIHLIFPEDLPFYICSLSPEEYPINLSFFP